MEIKRIGIAVSCTAGLVLALALLPLGMIGCASTSTHESAGEVIDDSTITAKVKANLVGDPNVSALDVKVQTYRGVVQLSGFVNNPDQIRSAEEDARKVAGVKDIQNNLVIKPAPSAPPPAPPQ